MQQIASAILLLAENALIILTENIFARKLDRRKTVAKVTVFFVA